MRRVLVSLLAILYLAITGGLTLCAHYCMGEEQGTELAIFNSEEEHACGACGTTGSSEGSDCCKDEHKVVKLEQKHVPANDVAVLHFAGFIALPVAQYGWNIRQSFVGQGGRYTAACNGPPIARSSTRPLYLQLRNFRV